MYTVEDGLVLLESDADLSDNTVIDDGYDDANEDYAQPNSARDIQNESDEDATDGTHFSTRDEGPGKLGGLVVLRLSDS